MKRENTDSFFRELTSRSGAYSEDNVRSVYFSMLKMITDSFRSGEEIELPHIGTFSVRERKARFKGNVQTGEREFLPATREIKFSPFYAFKEYVRKMRRLGE